MPRIQFSNATKEDDSILRALLCRNVMDGAIALTFRREPSYFYASGIQGVRTEVIKGVGTKNNTVAALGGRFMLPAYMNGVRTNIGYLADLRVEPHYRIGMTLKRAFDYLRLRHTSDPLPLYTTMILQDNTPALNTLAANRAGMPVYQKQGFVHTPLICLGQHKKAISIAGVEIARGRTSDELALFTFINREHGKFTSTTCHC